MKNRIVEGILVFLETKSPFISEEQRQKISYILSVIIGEMEKLIFLFFVFAFAGKWREYLLSLFVVLVTRSFAGGPHEQSNIKCLIHTFLFFICSLGLSRNDLLINESHLVIWILVALYAVYAPVVSEKRGEYCKKKKTELKLKSISGVVLVSILMVINKKLTGVITATLFLEMIEFLAILIMKGGQKYVGNNQQSSC